MVRRDESEVGRDSSCCLGPRGAWPFGLTLKRGWRWPLPDPRQPGCWECGLLGHIRRECPRMYIGGRGLVGRIQGNVVATQKEIRVAQSYELFGQGTEIIC